MSTPSTAVRTRTGAEALHRVSAGQAMHRGVLSVPLDTPLTKVAQMMARYRMHSVVALEEHGEFQTRFWGIVPAAELVRIATTQDLEDRTAGGCATADVATVEPTDTVYDAARLMNELGVEHVIVVDPVSNRPVGVISTLDVAQVLAGEHPRVPRGAYHVAQVMTRNVLTVRLETPIRDVARILSDNGISGVPVVAKGNVIGIVSEADIITKERGPAPHRGRLAKWFARPEKRELAERRTARTAGEAMTTPAMTIESWRLAADAAALMLDRGIDRLPVLEDGKLVGIVTRADLVSAFARSDDEIAHDIREDVLLRSYWIGPGEVDVLVRHGLVTLTGTVESELMTELVPESVQRVPGVVGVRSKITARQTETPPQFELLLPRA